MNWTLRIKRYNALVEKGNKVRSLEVLGPEKI
jgi:hypothetical protein